MIPYARHDIQQIDIDAVEQVLRSDFLTQGPVVPRFEAAVANRVGAGFAVAVNSATSALHIACLALDLGPGTLLWTSPVTFVASANCGLYCGAEIDFVDIDPRSFNICPILLETKLAVAAEAGRLPKLLVVVHMAGQSAEMAPIAAAAARYGVKIIEDASHAIGGHYRDAAVGSCTHSEITVFSFHPVKIITTAEGGMALTNNAVLAARLERLRSHGITRAPQLMSHPPDGPWYYQQIELGFNYRMTDLHAALGVSQLARLREYIDRRRALAARYDALLQSLPVHRPWCHPEAASAFHLYIIQLQDASRRLAVFAALRAADIGVNIHYIPVHLQPFYASMGFAPGDFPLAENYYGRAISLPLFPAMTEAQQDRVVQCLSALL